MSTAKTQPAAEPTGPPTKPKRRIRSDLERAQEVLAAEQARSDRAKKARDDAEKALAAAEAAYQATLPLVDHAASHPALSRERYRLAEERERADAEPSAAAS